MLRTVTSMPVALKWLKSTYLHIRLMKNPRYYGVSLRQNATMTEEQVDDYLSEILTRALDDLTQMCLVRLSDDGADLISPTNNGFLMSKNCISFDTMKTIITQLGASCAQPLCSIEDLLNLISNCKEFEDITLRNSEKSILNSLNSSKETAIRFKHSGKVKTNAMKINVLIQAQLGCINVTDFSLVQDTLRVFKFANKIAKCLMEFVLSERRNYELCLNTLLLVKSLTNRIWFDSPHIIRQFHRVGK